MYRFEPMYFILQCESSTWEDFALRWNIQKLENITMKVKESSSIKWPVTPPFVCKNFSHCARIFIQPVVSWLVCNCVVSAFSQDFFCDMTMSYCWDHSKSFTYFIRKKSDTRKFEWKFQGFFHIWVGVGKGRVKTKSHPTMMSSSDLTLWWRT
jgi:hypothetical protein